MCGPEITLNSRMLNAASDSVSTPAKANAEPKLTLRSLAGTAYTPQTCYEVRVVGSGFSERYVSHLVHRSTNVDDPHAFPTPGQACFARLAPDNSYFVINLYNGGSTCTCW